MDYRYNAFTPTWYYGILVCVSRSFSVLKSVTFTPQFDVLYLITLSYQVDSKRHKHTNTHLLKPLLLQTDDIKVKVCPQAIGPVESDSPGQTIPVGLMREAERHRENLRRHLSSQRVQTHTHYFSLFHTLSLSVGSALVSRCLRTLRRCICISGEAITQSLQIFRAVIGYNVA